MTDDIARLENELDQAKLSAAYDEAVEAYRNDASDENKATKDDLANQLVAVRSALRVVREAERLEIAEGDGVARPETVAGTSEVNV